MECASCKTPLPEKARFCLDCGAKAPDVPRSEPDDPIRAALRKALGQQYEIARLLGKGGMGAVYLATEAALEREVAIKVLPPDRGATQESRDRFRREARTAAKLSHPNIVPLYTFGDVDGTLYFVMGYVKGESLAARLKREGRLPFEESRRILIEIAEALDYAHKLGVIHRDIKPDNVLLEEGTGRALLTDFGVAKALGAGQTMTEVGSVLGTPQYMSPEQAQGKANIDHRTDLYSLGVMGYAMFAGRLPFEGPTPGDIMVQHITKEAPALASLATGIPAEVTSALTRCLAKDPDKRWRDATSLRAALAAADTDETHEEFEDLARLLRGIEVALFALLLLAAWWLGGGDVSDPFKLLPGLAGSLAGFFSVMLAIRFSQLRKASFESSQILKEIFKQPQAWMGWYPRRFRGKGDVWDRLPRQLKWTRATLAWAVLTAVLTLLPFLVFLTAFTSHLRSTGQNPYGSGLPDRRPPFIVVLPMFGAALILMARWQKQARALGLDERTAARTLDTPTTRRSFWSRPEISALLAAEAPPARASTAAEPTTPFGLAEAVNLIAGVLPEPARTLGVVARAVARQLADAIASLDKQIAGLARAFDPAEAKRLAGRLAALGPDKGPADENREIREILRKQLEPVSSLEARLEDAKARRSRHFAFLKALWVHVVELQGGSGDSAKTGSATGRIQKLLAQIEEQDASAKTVRADNAGVTEAISDAPTMER